MILDFGGRKFESEAGPEGHFFTVYDGEDWMKFELIDFSGDFTIEAQG